MNIYFKYIILFCFIIPSTNTFAVEVPWITKKERQEVTTYYLYETCSVIGETRGGMIPYFDCESYVYGVLDAYLAVRDTIPVAQRACFPKNLAPWQVLELSADYDENVMQQTIIQGYRPASEVLIEHLREKYPCE
ncbi:hypothetical protein I3A76_17615 [Salmonella enterica]|nr:hypothetical protein [Salmonella enterica]MBK0365231.1 hypothetical protein [Salmonella enterica]